MKKLLIVAVACLFVAGFSATAKAVSLVPGQIINPVADGFTLPAGSVELAAITAIPVNGINSTGGTVFTGTLSEEVYSDSTGMLFEYTFSNTSATGDSIAHLSAGGYTGFTTNVDVTAGTGVVPSSVDSTVNGVLDFNFLSGVSSGLSSDVLWIQTNAKSYTGNSTQLQDGGNSRTSTYGPAATPEPATMLMFGIGALGLVGLRKRKIA